MNLRRLRIWLLGFLTPKERSLYNQLLLGKHISSTIRVNRKARGWTQLALARKAGVSIITVHRLEKWWTVDCALESLLRIARAFDIGLLVQFTEWSKLLQQLAAGVIGKPVRSFDQERLVSTPSPKPHA